MNALSIKQNIALKISIFMSVFVFILQFTTGALWRNTGSWLLEAARTDTINMFQDYVTKQETLNMAQLKKSIAFDSKILQTILGPAIYNVTDIKPTLINFMDVTAIQAIAVIDEFNEPVGAVWRRETLESGDFLPTDFDIKNFLVLESDISNGEKSLGRVAIYYSDHILLKEIEDSKNEVFQHLETTKEKLDERQSSMRLWQLAGIICIMILFLSALFWFITKILTPLKHLANTIAEAEETGKLDTRASITSTDEIGRTAMAFNNMMQSQQTAFNEITEVIQGLSKGDLKLRVKGDQKGDMKELSTNVNLSLEMLSQTISQIIITSEQVNINSNEMDNSSQGLATGSSEQAASLQEISSTMTEVAAQTKANDENSNQAQTLTSQTLDIVKRGNGQMKAMLAAMGEIQSTSNDVNKIIKVIDNIAFQTNLLALNAAVEAARAGKYGKGFAVVADEVRSLAGRSAEAAKNTTELIQNSSKEVENGVSNAEKTASILADIDDSVKKVNEMTGEIVISSEIQKKGIEEINRGLTQINQVVQQNSSISEESASASAELSSQASKMLELMKQFSLQSEARQLLAIPTTPIRDRFLGNEKKITRTKRLSMAPPTAPELEPGTDDLKAQENSSRPARTKIILDDSDFGKY